MATAAMISNNIDNSNNGNINFRYISNITRNFKDKNTSNYIIHFDYNDISNNFSCSYCGDSNNNSLNKIDNVNENDNYEQK